MRETGVASQTTVIDFYNFFRDLCQVLVSVSILLLLRTRTTQIIISFKSWAERAQAQDGLGGRGRVVEIDESKFFR